MTSASEPKRARRRWILLVLLLVGLGWMLRPVVFLGLVAYRDPGPSFQGEESATVRNDRSGLEATEVSEVWTVPADPEAALAGLRDLLERARVEDLPVSIAGARHSMGGHTLAPSGIVVDMTGFDRLELDRGANLLRAGAGALWSEILAFLDPQDLSVAIMQSNDSFTVGGSVSVNCHGWQHGRPPIAASVRSFRILLADGRLVECSRDEEAELFSLALGGYGLFGILIDVDLELVPNELYALESVRLGREELGEHFLGRARDPGVALALGRVSIRPDALFEEAIFKELRRVPSDKSLPPISGAEDLGLRRTVFRGSVASDYGKRLRWTLESRVAPWLAAEETTRNNELAESVDTYANLDAHGTDILHEYFVPHAALAAFLEQAATLIGDSPCDLLNVTVRDVREDPDTFLRYADQDVFGLVMLFHQARTESAEAEMEALTRRLIDLSLDLGGRYYLPYRRHATRTQFEACYPMAGEFFRHKRRYDPDERFQNRFYQTYGI